jgi:hypothetical protein
VSTKLTTQRLLTLGHLPGIYRPRTLRLSASFHAFRVAGKHTTTATWPRALIYAVHLMAELAGAVYPAVFSQPAKEAK